MRRKPDQKGPDADSPMQLGKRASTNTLATALKNAYLNRNYKPESWWADESRGGSRPAPANARNLLSGPVVNMPRDQFERMYKNARGSIRQSNLA